jgi:hypothetical protein
LTKAAPPTSKATAVPAPPKALEPAAEPARDNVVQISAGARRKPSSRRRAAPQEPPAPSPEPKKARLPKHRKPGLVKPA